MQFNYFDAACDEESVEGFEDIEEGLRALFREDILPMVVEAYGADDEIAISEAFNNWTDMLCKDGEISAYVYENVTLED